MCHKRFATKKLPSWLKGNQTITYHSTLTNQPRKRKASHLVFATIRMRTTRIIKASRERLWQLRRVVGHFSNAKSTKIKHSLWFYFQDSTPKGTIVCFRHGFWCKSWIHLSRVSTINLVLLWFHLWLETSLKYYTLLYIFLTQIRRSEQYQWLMRRVEIGHPIPISLTHTHTKMINWLLLKGVFFLVCWRFPNLPLGLKLCHAITTAVLAIAW